LAVVKEIVDIGQPSIARGGLIDLGEAFHVSGFMRTFLVEDLNEVVEPGLLLQTLGTGRGGR